MTWTDLLAKFGEWAVAAGLGGALLALVRALPKWLAPWFAARTKRENAEATLIVARATATTREGDATGRHLAAQADAIAAKAAVDTALAAEVTALRRDVAACREDHEQCERNRIADRQEIAALRERVDRLDSLAPKGA